jgi:hypothetical protein
MTLSNATRYRTGKFTRYQTVNILLGGHSEYQHVSGGKLIASKFGVAFTGDIICTGDAEIRDMRTVFEMAVVDHESLKAGERLMSNEDVHHEAVHRFWTIPSSEPNGCADTTVSGYWLDGVAPEPLSDHSFCFVCWREREDCYCQDVQLDRMLDPELRAAEREAVDDLLGYDPVAMVVGFEKLVAK